MPRYIENSTTMSSPITPAIQPALSAEVSLDNKRSVDDESKFAADDGTVKTAGVIDTFLGRDRQALQSEPLVWREGAGPFARSLGKRLQGVFTRRFLVCLVAGQLLSVCITSTSVLTTELGMHGWAVSSELPLRR